jgi:hypothetical protein
MMPEKQSLNRKELKVVDVLHKRGPLTIRQMARLCFPGVRPITKADSQTRNSLRRPLRDGLVKRVGHGTYEAR